VFIFTACAEPLSGHSTKYLAYHLIIIYTVPFSPLLYNFYIVSGKNGTTLFLSITLPNAGQFSPADLAVNF